MVILATVTFLSPWAALPTPSATPPPPFPTPACTAPEFRQFDFWIGSWTVKNPSGKQVGTSNITQASAGCAIREEWKSVSGNTGMSLNYFDPADRKWHQDWVGGDGTILHLEGNLAGDAMVLKGPSKTSTGTTLNRITWTLTPNGQVRQEWSTSGDDGASWQTSFIGIYEKS